MDKKEVSLELIWNELKAMRKQLDEGSKKRVSKAKLLALIEQRDSISVEEVKRAFRISKVSALEVMQELAVENKDLMFKRGSPYRPSCLLRESDDNRFDFIAERIIEDFGRKAGTTMRVGHIANAFNLNLDETQRVVSIILRSRSFQLVHHPNFIDRRIKKVR